MASSFDDSKGNRAARKANRPILPNEIGIFRAHHANTGKANLRFHGKDHVLLDHILHTVSYDGGLIHNKTDALAK